VSAVILQQAVHTVGGGETRQANLPRSTIEAPSGRPTFMVRRKTRTGATCPLVRAYLGRAAAAGIGWPLATDVTDEQLMARLFVNAGVRAGVRLHAEPDWPALVRELKRPGVNLMVLWDEYREGHPQGYAYSRFCQLFREFEQRLSPTMRQQHVVYGYRRTPDVPPYNSSTTRTPSSTIRKSAVASCPTRRVRRLLSTARTWSHTATLPAPAEAVATTMGGRGVGPVDSGTTTTVRRARFKASAVSTTAGRVLRISLPRVGSRSTHHTSPRRTVTGGVTDWLTRAGP
jgi:hypothetical protein